MHEYFMQRALDLAKKGHGYVSPNPLVGALIVKDGKIIAEGSHLKHGKAHAEAHAFSQLKESAEGATLYVTLEPCCHTNKLTPPCAQEIIKHKIKKVFIATLDPNPYVNGKGVELLKEHGIEVETGLLEHEAKKLNEIFNYQMISKKPFICLKTAISLDGKIALHNGQSKWITSNEARLDCHYERASYDAIVIGAQTLRSDNPSLTIRHPELEFMSKKRLILTTSGNLPADSKVFKDEFKDLTYVVTDQKTAINVLPSSQIIRLSSLTPFDFHEFYEKCKELKIHSLWIEGGQKIFSLFYQNKQFQKIIIYQAPKILGSGTEFASFKLSNLENCQELKCDSTKQLGSNFKYIFR